MFFASLACFWSFCCIGIATWLILSFRQQLAIVRQRDEDSKASGQAAPALTPVQSAFLAAGMYLCMFSWFISLTWRVHDRITAAIVTGAALVMGVWFFLRQRALSGEAALRRAYRNMTLCCALMVAVINLRIDVWAAAKYGLSVAEVQTLLPLWIVPLLTFILVAWIAAGLALTKPKTLPPPV
jgi:type IV secretory pathway TrbD component